MQQFEITLAGMMDNYNTATISFPATQEELNKAYNHVSQNGMRDYELVDYEADFRIDFPDFKLLNEIAEMKEEDYNVFLTFHNGGCDLRDAFKYATCYEYQLWENVEDAGDIAYKVLEMDEEFQACPEFVKRNFDYDQYGEELESGGTYFWDTENKRAVQLF